MFQDNQMLSETCHIFHAKRLKFIHISSFDKIQPSPVVFVIISIKSSRKDFNQTAQSLPSDDRQNVRQPKVSLEPFNAMTPR